VESKVEEGDGGQLGICASDRTLELGERISWRILGGIVRKRSRHRWVESTLEQDKLMKEMKKRVDFSSMRSTMNNYERLDAKDQAGKVL
jgi:hypothetical protein